MKQRNIAAFLIEVIMCDPIQQTNSVTWSFNILCDAVGVSLLIPMNSCDHKVLLVSHDLQTLMVFLAPSSPASFWFWLSCPFRFELKKPSQEQFHWPLWALPLYGLNWGCTRAESSFVLPELGSLEKQSAQASLIKLDSEGKQTSSSCIFQLVLLTSRAQATNSLARMS